MQSIPSVKFAFRRPSGIIAGLTAPWAIFGFILAIDSELNLPPGTFYEMIGLAFGIDSSYAVYIGFLLHMITGTILGIVYNVLYLKKYQKTVYNFCIQRSRNRNFYWSSCLGDSFSSTKLWNNATNITEYDKLHQILLLQNI